MVVGPAVGSEVLSVLLTPLDPTAPQLIIRIIWERILVVIARPRWERVRQRATVARPWRSFRLTRRGERRPAPGVRATIPWRRRAPRDGPTNPRGRRTVRSAAEYRSPPVSPSFSSGTATAAANATSGWVRTSSSTAGRADVLTSPHDEVGRAANDGEPAVVVDGDDVAHQHPAVVGEQLLVRRLVPVVPGARRPASTGRNPGSAVTRDSLTRQGCRGELPSRG